MDSLDKIKQENLGERIEDYKKILEGSNKEKLQEMIITLDDDSKFSDFYSVKELSNFEKQYGIPIKTGKDLEYLAFAVGEKLQELEEIEKQEELRKKEERKITPKIRKMIAATALATSLAGFGLQTYGLPVPNHNYVTHDKYEELAIKIFPLDQLSSDIVDYKEALREYFEYFLSDESRTK